MRRIHLTMWLAVLASWSVPASATNTFQGLGDLPGGAFYTRVWDLSGNGSVPVGTASATGQQRAFRWQAGVMESLVAPFSWTDAQAVSAHGGVVVGMSWRWDNGIVTRVLGPDGNPVLQTSGLSADGRVMVGHWGALQGFRSVDGVAETLALPPGSTTLERLVASADGSVVAGDASVSGSSRTAFRWENGTSVLLPHLPGDFPISNVEGISANGLVIVGESVFAPVYWQAGAVHELPTLAPFTSGTAYDASADGSVIVGTSDSYDEDFELVEHATLWVGGQPYSLAALLTAQGIDLTGWHLGAIDAVSDDGLTMTGQGRNPSGQTEAWIARLDRCSNGIDDDGDGLTDHPSDPGCATVASMRENPKCDDDVDNDGDGALDWDGGSGAGTPDSECVGHPSRDRETSGGCGLGAELVFAIGLLQRSRCRRLG